MAQQRLEAAQDVPTFRELGVDWVMSGWRGILLPQGVPPERFQCLAQAALRVARGDALARAMAQAGFNRSVAGPEQFERFLVTRDRVFGKIMTGEAFSSVRRARFGPHFVPAILGGLGAVVLVALALQGGLRRGEDVEPLTLGAYGRVLLVPAWIIAYLALVPQLGFLLTAGLLLFALFVVLQVRLLTALLLTGLVIPLVYQVFAGFLRVPLPWGLFGW
jgi:hypothetical protein